MERKVDFNLFQTFIAVYELGSLKKAGIELGLSESAISKHINKLSEQLGEELFVRTAKGLEPTFAAQSRIDTVRLALEQISKAIPPQTLDPLEYKGTIRIALFNSYMQTYGSRIYALLSKTFPQAFIELVSWSTKTTHEILKGEVQLGVHYYNESRPSNIYQVPMSEDPIVAFVGKHHAIPSWEELLTWQYVQVKAAGWSEDRYRYLEVLSKQNVFLDIRGSVDDASVCAEILNQSKVATFMQRSYKMPQMKEVMPPEPFQYVLRTTSCISLSQRHAPLQKLLLNQIQSIFK